MAIIGFIFLFIILAWATFIVIAHAWWMTNTGSWREEVLLFIISSIVVLFFWYMLFKNAPFMIVVG